MNLYTTLEIITPDRAREYLEHNTNNRPMRGNHISRIANDIRNGRWALNGAPIVFNGDGTLLDGQHRLAAIVSAELPVEALVVRGVSKSAMSTIDTGMKRGASDVASLAGFEYAAVSTSSIRQLLNLKRNSYNAARTITNAEIIEFLQRRPDIPQAAAATTGITVVAQSTLCTWYYLAAFVAGQRVAADIALEVLRTGAPSYPNDPIHVFRERIIKLPRGSSSSPLVRSQILWTLIGAWNAHTEGEPWQICKIRKNICPMPGVDYSEL